MFCNFKEFCSQVVQSLNDAIYILTIKILPRNSLGKHSIKNICRLDRKAIHQHSLNTLDILFHCVQFIFLKRVLWQVKKSKEDLTHQINISQCQFCSLLAPTGALKQAMQLSDTYKEIQTTTHISLCKQSGHLFTFLPTSPAFEVELQVLIKLSQQRTVDGLSFRGSDSLYIYRYVFLTCVYLTFTVFSAYSAIKVLIF